MPALPALDADEKRARFAAVRELLASKGMVLPAELRDDDAPVREPDALSTGSEEIDALLPGGFPRRAVTEIAGSIACGKTSLVARAVANVTAARRMAAWIDPQGEAYPPAFAQAGADLSRLLWVRAPIAESLWAAEVLLQSGCFELVVLDATALPAPKRGAEAATHERRTIVLRSAAEQHGVALVTLSGESAVFGAGAPPALRLEVRRTRDGAVEVEVRRSRYGGAGRRARLRIGACSASGSVPVPDFDLLR